MNRFLKGSCLFVIISALLFESCARDQIRYRPQEGVEPVVSGAPLVRVLIISNTDKARINSKGLFFSAVSGAGGVIKKFEGGGEYAFRGGRGYIRLIRNGAVVFSAEKFIVSSRGGKILVNGNPYRGSLRIDSRGDKEFSVINIIGVDNYLKGVLPAEIGYLGEEAYEAYRAQAVVSRSYALSKLNKTKEKDHDLKATIMDQVYRGMAGETSRANRAVEETTGLAAVWNGKPIKAYYSSCCGGHTADIRFAWPWKEDFPYLYGVRDGRSNESEISFCRQSSHFRWRVSWREDKLERILSRTLEKEVDRRIIPFRKIVDLKAGGFAPDGRLKYLDIITDKDRYRIYGDRIRWVLRPASPEGAILKSTLFKLSVRKERGRVVLVEILGGGNGHGVGMCQTGAIKMAKLGYNAGEIISHYYPRVEVEKIY